MSASARTYRMDHWVCAGGNLLQGGSTFYQADKRLIVEGFLLFEVETPRAVPFLCGPPLGGCSPLDQTQLSIRYFLQEGIMYFFSASQVHQLRFQFEFWGNFDAVWKRRTIHSEEICQIRKFDFYDFKLNSKLMNFNCKNYLFLNQALGLDVLSAVNAFPPCRSFYCP